MLGRVPRAVKAIVTAVLLAAAVLVGKVTATMNSPEWRIVRSAFRATYTSPASYTQVVEHRFGGQTRREEYRVWQDGRRRKVVQTEPASLAGLTIFRDRLSEVALAPGFPYVLKSRLPRGPGPVDPGPWRPLRRRPRLEVGEGVLPGGVRARTVFGYSGRTVQMKLWVDPQTGFILRQERYNRHGDLFDVTLNRDIVTSPRGLGKALRVQIPSGVQVVTSPRQWHSELALFVLKKEAPFPFLMPRRVPRRYRLAHAEVLYSSGRQLVAIRFARGRNGFTLFEYREDGSAATVPSEAVTRFVAPDARDGGRVFRTARSSLALVAVGSLSESEARRLFSSLQTIYPVKGQEKADQSRTQTQ